MKIILSYLINSEIEEYIKGKGIEIIKTIPFLNEKNSVLMHPDIQCFSDKNNFFTYKNLSDYYSKFISNIIVSNEIMQSEYPKDVLFNCLKINNYIFCNENIIDENLLIYLKKTYEIINVKQGYSNCSCLYLGNGYVATSDKGMEKILNQHNFKTVFIDNSNIILKDYKHGFIGGSAVKLDDEIVFFGNIKLPEYKEITAFLQNNCIKYKYFNFPLEDFGSAVFI